MFKILALSIILLFIFSGCQKDDKDSYNPSYSDAPKKTMKTYLFGIHPLHNPKRLFEIYQPLIDYINSRLRNVELKLEASRNYAAYDKKLFSGYFDYSLPNPYQTVESIKYGYTVFGKMGDDENFRGIILVRKDSNIKSVDDLKGKTVSYPAATALAATIMPQYFLHIHGLNISEDIINSYVGSQESSIMNVYLKKSIAASTWPPPWNAFIKERPEIAKEVEIKWTTKPLLNNGLVVKKGIPKELTTQISNILFNLHTSSIGKKLLEPMELTKFEEANNQTYSKVIDFLLIFEKDVRKIRSTK